MARSRSSLGFLGKFGRTHDLIRLDAALRSVDLHPGVVPEAIKLTIVNLLKDHAIGDEPAPQVYRPAAVIVDLGLPDGRGEDLIADLDRATPRVGVILATSGDAGADARARAAGADGLLLKPVASLGIFQQEVLRHVPQARRPWGPYAVQAEVIHPDPLAYRDDLDHVHTLLGHDRTPDILRYAAQFLSSVAHAAGDDVLADAASGLLGHCPETGIARVMGLIAARLASQAAM
jgi:CheY-like chemotaxis protein